MISDVDRDHHRARRLLVGERAEPVPAVAAAVDAGVDRHADQHEAHAEEHPGHPRPDDVGHLPQLAAQPPALGLERRPPHEHADRHEAHVLERVDERVPHRGLEEDREVPAVEHEHVDGTATSGRRSHRTRRRGAASAPASPAGAAAEAEHRVAAPASSSGAARSAISRCWAMWADSSSSPSEWTGEKKPITHSAIPRCQKTICARGTPRRAPAGRAARADTAPRRRNQDQRPGPACSMALALQRAMITSTRRDHDIAAARARTAGSGTPRPPSAAG